MALEDVAKLVAPHKPHLAMKLLRAFYGKPHGITREEILRETGLGEKMFEYFLTKLRHYRIVQGTKAGGVYRYYLSPDAFHARIDTLFVDPVKTIGRG